MMLFLINVPDRNKKGEQIDAGSVILSLIEGLDLPDASDLMAESVNDKVAAGTTIGRIIAARSHQQELISMV